MQYRRKGAERIEQAMGQLIGIYAGPRVGQNQFQHFMISEAFQTGYGKALSQSAAMTLMQMGG